MRPVRFLTVFFAAFILIWSTATIRGDQPAAPGKSGEHFAAPATDDSADDTRMSGMGRFAQLAASGRLDKAIARARGLRRRLATDTHVDEFLDAALGDDDGGDGPAGGQAETSVAVDSTGQHIVIGFNDTRGFSLNPQSLSGFMYSDDGGATFTNGGQLPTPGTDLIGTTRYPQVFGDPEVKYLGGSTFVYFSIMVKKFSSAGTAQTMCVHRSTDYGHTWQGPFEVTTATNPHGATSGTAVNARDAADKEFAAVDPDTGRVMMSWSNFTSTAFAPSGIEISSTYSDDLATATPPTWSARRIIAATSADGQASQPFFAGGSTNAYVVWRRFPGGFNQNVGFARSADNGATWSVPVNLTSAFLTSDEILGNDRTNTSPSIAVDNTAGPNRGNVYVVYANNANHDGADIMFQRSSDGGVTFSAAMAIDGRPGADRAQWFPWVTVDTSTGRVYVFYYDQGIATSGDLSETTVQFSDDGGLSWSKPMPLTDRPFHAAYGNDTGQPNIGDYNQAVAQNGELFAVWAGTTPVGFTDGQPSTSMTTPDVVFKRLPAASTKLSINLTPSAITFTDGANGYIDPGDLVGFTVPLTNYVTNAINSAAITSVQATLSTSTAGVSVVAATRSYGDIAAGATAANATPFRVQFDQAFVPGRHVEFTLAVASAQGTVLLPFTQATGTPVTTTLLSENFDGVAAGALPGGWATSHAGGNTIVPWTTSNAFTGAVSNAAFHANANDGATATTNTRFERLFSPSFDVPATAEYVTLDFDVWYNTEDEPALNIETYDGFLLRVTDQTPGNTLRSVQIESFAEEFTTGPLQFYPKKMPRSSNANYLADLSAWGGASNGWQHVHVKLPGMAGTRAQLRWEYTQDSVGICSDVRPGSGTCGVAFDNLVVKSVISATTVSTAATLTSSQNPSDFGQPVTLTAAVTAGSPVTVGTVTFHEGATVLVADVPVDGSGHASITTSTLTSGTHSITADYTGTSQFAASSARIVQSVDTLPTLTINDVTVVEGNSGTANAVFTVSLSAPTHTATVRASFATADGTATAPSDYAAQSGSVTFAAGTSTQTISVPVNGDFVIEANETFSVNLSAAVNATIADGQGVGTIQNDDTIATTLGALAGQVGACADGLNAGQCQALLTRIAAAQRDIAVGRNAGAVHALEQFIGEVQNDTRTVADAGAPPRLNPATGSLWIDEAQSIIASLSS